MPNKKRKCKHCKTYTNKFVVHGLNAFCDNMDCAVKFAIANRQKGREKIEKEKRKEHKAKLKQVRRNPKAEALKAAQLLARVSSADDNGYCTCVTCGHIGPWNDGFDGGHFIAKGNCSYWMLDDRNIWPQCKACNGNGMKFGNKEALYTLWMVDKFGREFVDHMHEMRKTVIKRTAKDYDEYIADAKMQIAEHKKRIGA